MSINFYNLTQKVGNDDILNNASHKIQYKKFLSKYHDEAEAFFKKYTEPDKTEVYRTDPSKFKNEYTQAELRDDLSETGINDTRNPILLINGAFYIATRYSVDGLIYLINISASSNTVIGYMRNECLEKIILADHNDLTAPYSDRYLMIIADCLAGLYTFNTVRDYAKAIILYQRVTEMIKGHNDNLVGIVEKRIACCRMLDSTELNPPSAEILEKVNKNSQTDNFSRVVLACYYLTAPDVYYADNSSAYYEAGVKLLAHAIDENYRPGIALLEYLCKKEIVTEFTKNEVKKFRKSNNPPISENHWYE